MEGCDKEGPEGSKAWWGLVRCGPDKRKLESGLGR